MGHSVCSLFVFIFSFMGHTVANGVIKKKGRKGLKGKCKQNKNTCTGNSKLTRSDNGLY